MPKIISCIAWLRRSDYAAHRALDPEGLQTRYDQWLKEAQAGEQEAQRNGWVTHRIMLDPQELAAWARERGMEINSRARAEFATILFAARNDADGNTREGH